IIASAERHDHITIRVKDTDLQKAEEGLKQIWEEHFPMHMFYSNRVAHNFDAQHMTEHRLQVILLLFTYLSVFVACLGLLGLSAFSAEQRIKEIGIRKTLGASMKQIIFMISADFSKLVIIAGLIALPAAYFIMHDWLSNFPYRRDMQLWVFILAMLAAWTVSMITVFINAYSAARVNPVNTLQHE
ncbi:MAG: FtsX-like permease family protein, partial [Bacteroidetes bacterium]